MDDYNKPIWQLTVGELVEILDSRKNSNEENPIKEIDLNKKYVYGLLGLAKILGCSKNHAGKLKSKGIFDEAIIQNGRKIIIDAEKAIDIIICSIKNILFTSPSLLIFKILYKKLTIFNNIHYILFFLYF